jgi:hypothetical protein
MVHQEAHSFQNSIRAPLDFVALVRMLSERRCRGGSNIAQFESLHCTQVSHLDAFPRERDGHYAECSATR